MADALQARVVGRAGRRSVDAELSTAPGTLVIVGPNGAGKTTLLELVLGARPVERGRVVVGDGVLLDTELGIDTPLEERRIAYVPQDYALFPHLSVRKNIEFAVASASDRAGRAARAERVEAVVQELGLSELRDRAPATLSGGEKQRVALARALSVSPRALLLDEPLAALDVPARREVRRFLAAYLVRLGLPTVVVTHDARDARELGDRFLVLEEGRVTQAGTWDDLAHRPASAFVEEFVASSDPGARPV